MKRIGNVYIAPSNPVLVSALINLSTSNQEVKTIYDWVRLDMIAKAIDGSITNKYFKKLRL